MCGKDTSSGGGPAEFMHRVGSGWSTQGTAVTEQAPAAAVLAAAATGAAPTPATGARSPSTSHSSIVGDKALSAQYIGNDAESRSTRAAGAARYESSSRSSSRSSCNKSKSRSSARITACNTARADSSSRSS